MKKSLLLLAIFAIAGSTVYAQHAYKRFRVDLGVGYNISTDDSYTGGGSISLEPKFALSPAFALGFRAEFSIVDSDLSADIDPAYANVSGGVTYKSSYLATLDWYILPHTAIRPFVGGGVGAFVVPSRTFEPTGGEVTVPSTSNFGGMLRVGADWKHLRLAAEYNIAGKDEMDARIDYVNIKVAVFFGGGKK